MSKEEIALELALAVVDTEHRPAVDDPRPETLGEAVAALYNAIFENLKI